MRRRSLFLCTFIFLAALGPGAWARMPEMLTIAQLEKQKQRPCTFISVWATWCSICLQEMPDLVTWMSTKKHLNPVIIDVSKPFLQDQVAKKWKVLINAPFPTYLKPGGNDDEYHQAIDKAYDDTLPFSVLYDRGKRKKVWRGALDLRSLDKELAHLCK